MTVKTPLILFSLLAASLPARMYGGAVTFAFTGTVDTVAALDPQSPFPDNVDFGTPFSGTYTFDPAATNQISGDPQTGTYISMGSPFGMTLSLGGLNLSYNGVTISIENDYFPTTDGYFASFFADPTSDKPTGVELSIGLMDFTGTAFSNNSLPGAPPSLAAFQTASMFFTDTLVDPSNSADQVELTGDIHSLTAVPEPASGILVGASILLAIIAFRRRFLSA